jgi:hypothetical protein
MCSDYRFVQVVIDRLNEEGLLGKYDLIALPGSQGNARTDERFFSSKLGTLIDLHDPEVVWFIAHRDCGAYGGSQAFQRWHHEREMYVRDLREATELVQRDFPGVEVKRFIINCDGFDVAELPINPRFEEV